MKRSVSALSKLNCGQRAWAALALGAMTVIGLPAQTFTTLDSFMAQSANIPWPGWSRPPTGTSTGRRRPPAPTAVARSSKLPRVAR
jgi:hypothetical protein